MTDRRRAPIEVLERLAEALADWSAPGYFPVYQTNDPRAAGHNRVAEALAAYRAAVDPLRTRAEVDAEIVATVRAKDGWHNSARLCELISEPTAPNSGPSSADTEEVPSPRPPVSPAGGLFFDEDLIRRAIDPTVPPGHMRIITASGAVDVLIEPSGSPGVAAAKESKDNAAAPEGAANDRECNCDQALHLERRIGDAVRAIRRSSTIPAGLLHELLGILEGEA